MRDASDRIARHRRTRLIFGRSETRRTERPYEVPAVRGAKNPLQRYLSDVHQAADAADAAPSAASHEPPLGFFASDYRVDEPLVDGPLVDPSPAERPDGP